MGSTLLAISVPIAAALAAAALVIGAGQDIGRRQIPDRVSIMVAASALPLLMSLSPGEALGHVGLAVAMFLLGTVAFAYRLVGGGDVKLFAVVSLWAGLSLFSLLIVIMSLASVAIAVLMLIFDQLFRSPARAGGLGASTGLKAPLPLGLAIAIAGVFVIMQHAALLPIA